MVSKIMWLDDEWANGEQPTTVATNVTEYHASGMRPISELNELEGSLEMAQEELFKESKEKEALFGENIRSTIRAIRG